MAGEYESQCPNCEGVLHYEESWWDFEGHCEDCGAVWAMEFEQLDYDNMACWPDYEIET